MTYGFWFLVRYARRGRRPDLFAYTGIAVVALLTHYAAVVALAAGGGVLAVALASGRLGRDPLRDVALAGLPIGLVGAALYYLHLGPHVVGSTVQQDALSGWLSPFLHRNLADLGTGFVGLQRYLFDGHAGLALILFAGGATVALARRRFLMLGIVGATLFMAAALSLGQLYPFGGSRHSSYLASVVVLLMAELLSECWLHGRALRVAAALLLGFCIALPRVPNAMTGVAALAIRPSPDEKTTRFEIAERYRAELEQAHSGGGVVLLDKWTYHLLMPFYAGQRRHLRQAGDPPIRRFDWGKARIVVSPTTRLRVRGEGEGNPNHLLGFLQQADRSMPGLALREQRDARVFFGGWGVSRYAGLGSLPAFSDFRLDEGLAFARIDLARYMGR